MTRDEMIDMAVSVGLLRRGDVRVEPDTWGLTEVRRFASLVAAAEREECAQVCDERELANLYGVKECATAIRARGNT